MSVVRVLLVEDNDGDARIVELMIQGTFGKDIELSRALSLSEALELLDSATPDCVVLDLGLPDAQGIDALRRVLAVAPHTALVVLTGQYDENLALQSLQQGAEDYLVKGQIEATVLARAMRYAVERKAS